MTLLVLAVLAGCPAERGTVKTFSDPGVKYVEASPRRVSVELLGGLPSEYSSDKMPRQKSETQLYAVEGTLLGAKLEADGDVHAVLAGKTGATLIVEFPDPKCTMKAPQKYRDAMAKARADVLKLLPRLSGKFRKLDKSAPIKVMGPAFWDKPHGQDGVAPNAAEIHPVLSVSVP